LADFGGDIIAKRAAIALSLAQRCNAACRLARIERISLPSMEAPMSPHQLQRASRRRFLQFLAASPLCARGAPSLRDLTPAMVRRA